MNAQLNANGFSIMNSLLLLSLPSKTYERCQNVGIDQTGSVIHGINFKTSKIWKIKNFYCFYIISKILYFLYFCAQRRQYHSTVFIPILQVIEPQKHSIFLQTSTKAHLSFVPTSDAVVDSSLDFHLFIFNHLF